MSSSEIGNDNRLIDFIGNVIKATSDPNDQESANKAYILPIPLAMY